MSRVTNLLIVFGLLALLVLYLALPYLSPPAAVVECQKINTDSYWDYSEEDECLESVAMILKDAKICRYIKGDQTECKDLVREHLHVESWPLQKTDPIFYDDDMYWYYENKTLACAVDGLAEGRVYYRKEYMDSSISYPTYQFLSDCEQVLQNTDKNVCNYTAYSYEESTCRMNIGLAKGESFGEVCGNSTYDCDFVYSIYKNDIGACNDDECYLALAIMNKKPEFCEQIGYGYYDDDKRDCLYYFALKDLDTSYCNNLSSSEDMYYCRAVILAEQGA